MVSWIQVAAATLLAIVPYAPHTVGGWSTYLKPYRYSDVLVRGDTVWCATREAGLLRYSRAGQRFAAISRFPNGLASNELSALAYDRSDRLWVGTYGSGVSRMSADGDTLWIGTPRGIAFWDGTQIAGSLPIFGQPSPFASDNITGVVVRKDTIWVSTSDGVYFSRR